MATPRLVETKLIKTLFRCPKMSCKTRGGFDFDLNIILTRQQILLDKKGIWSTKFVERAKYHFWKKERRFLEQGASIPPNGDDCREGNVATEAACPRLTDWIYLPRLGAQTCNGGKKVHLGRLARSAGCTLCKIINRMKGRNVITQKFETQYIRSVVRWSAKFSFLRTRCSGYFGQRGGNSTAPGRDVVAIKFTRHKIISHHSQI